MTLRIGVLSDTHLYSVTEAFRAIFEKYLSNVDMILHAGDYETVDIIEFLSGKEFHGVYGNMDPVEIRELLPRKKVIELGPFRVALIHGWGSSQGVEDRIRPEFHDVDVIVYGHSHRPANHMRDDVLLFNPGTVSGFYLFGMHSVGFLEVGDTIQGEIVNVSYMKPSDED
jgi:putative phosphoesterase